MFRILKRHGLVVLALVLALAYFLPHPRVLLDAVCWTVKPQAPTHADSLRSSSPPVHDTPTRIQPLNPETENSIRTAVLNFVRYGAAASIFFRRKRSRFDKLPRSHRPLADAIGYARHFQAAQNASDVNADFAMRIAEHAVQFYNLPSDFISRADEEVKDGEDGLLPWGYVNDALDHLLRDWSEESRMERAQVFPPVLSALERHLVGVRGKKRILLPGIGLGRLAHEIADKGYVVEACERDHSSILAYRYLVNGTNAPFEHTLYPFASQWTHQLNGEMRYRPVRVPDKVPTQNVKLIEGDFLQAFTEDGVYDAVVTLFFIDMSVNIVDFLETIWRVLKAGGLWINLGPFKWTQRSIMQLSAEETMRLSDLIGLQVDRSSYQAFDTTYAHQPESLLKFTYVTQFWTAKKQARIEADGRK